MKLPNLKALEHRMSDANGFQSNVDGSGVPTEICFIRGMNQIMSGPDEEKVDVVSKDSYGRTPLSWTANNGGAAIVKLLLHTEKVEGGARILMGGPRCCGRQEVATRRS